MQDVLFREHGQSQICAKRENYAPQKSIVLHVTLVAMLCTGTVVSYQESFPQTRKLKPTPRNESLPDGLHVLCQLGPYWNVKHA